MTHQVPEAAPRRRSWRKLYMRYGLFLLVVILGLYLYNVMTFRDTVAENFRQFTAEAASALDLPEGQRARVLAAVDRLLQRYREDQLSEKQDERIKTGLEAARPVIDLVALSLRTVASSGLPEDVKNGARESVRRLVRGLIEGKISPADLDPVMGPLPHREDMPQAVDFRKPIGDEDLRKVVAAMDAVLEANEVSPADSAGDVAGVVEPFVDSVLEDTGSGSSGGPATGAESVSPEPPGGASGSGDDPAADSP